MRKVVSAICIFALVAISHATPKLEVLSVNDGQKLVRNKYQNEPFVMGSFNNDVSLLFPLRWTIPNKGVYACFSSAEQNYSDGILWEIVEIEDGELFHHRYPLKPNMSIWFQPYQLFEVKWGDGRHGLFYYEVRWKDVYTDAGDKIALIYKTWYELSVDANGGPDKRLVKGGLQSFFRPDSAVLIRNVIPHRYKGAEAEIAKDSYRPQKRLEEGERQIWALTAEQKERIADMHREYVEKSNPQSVVSNVYVIAGDCNFDGKCDAYVTTDMEKLDEKNYKWTLYIADESQFSQSENSLSNTFGRVEIITIDSTVSAAIDSFFRFDRISLPSYVMPVVATSDGKVEVLDYVMHDSCTQQFRRQKGLEATWFACCFDLNNKTGIASLNDYFEQWADIVRAVRIPCETVSLPSKGGKNADTAEK